MDVSSDLEQDSLTVEHPRCIVHVDIDYFYAQVEELAHPEFKGKPLGVQQKNLVVTSNYEARQFGVKKCMSVDEALRLCPTLKLIRGEDLTPYKRMSARVSEVLHQFTHQVERLGLDENFLDVSSLVSEYFNKSCNGDKSTTEDEQESFSNCSMNGFKVQGHVYVVPEEECPCGCHNRLAIASNIATDIRKRIKSELGLTCSAGISHNKLLAKLGGSLHKPDGQTIVYPCSASSLLTSLGPVSKIPGVGRRTAESLTANHIRSVEDVRKTPLESLQVKIGRDLARKIKDSAEGIDDSPVKPSGRPQSIGLEDGFKKVSLVDEVESRLNVLLRRLCESAQEDGRIPLCLKLTVRKQDGGFSAGKRESRQCPLHPNPNGKLLDHGKMLSLVMKLFHRVVDVSRPFHLTLLGLAFTKFQEDGNKSSGKNGSITSFLRKQVAVQSVMDISSEEGLSDIGSSMGSPMSTTCDCEESEEELNKVNKVQFSNNCQRFIRNVLEARATPSPIEDEDISSEVEPSPKKTKLEVWLSGRRESPSIEMEDLRLNTPSSSPISKGGAPTSTMINRAIPIDLDKPTSWPSNSGAKKPNDLLKYFITNK